MLSFEASLHAFDVNFFSKQLIKYIDLKNLETIKNMTWTKARF